MGKQSLSLCSARVSRFPFINKRFLDNRMLALTFHFESNHHQKALTSLRESSLSISKRTTIGDFYHELHEPLSDKSSLKINAFNQPK